MSVRSGWMLIGLACVGCQVLAPQPSGADPAAAEQFWQLGQDAMKRGAPDEALKCYQRSLVSDPGLSRNYLSMAAAHLEKGDEAAACVPLSRYVAANPEHARIRAHLAELLLRQQRNVEAQSEYERFVADEQERSDADLNRLIHCHRRLMEIAEAGDDAYGEHLYRGIGLYLLARQRATVEGDDETLPTEGLLCKAAAELTLAQQVQPHTARPSWYLYEVWSRLAQRQPALKSLHATQEAAPFSYLTPSEQRGLQLALQHHQNQGLAK